MHQYRAHKRRRKARLQLPVHTGATEGDEGEAQSAGEGDGPQGEELPADGPVRAARQAGAVACGRLAARRRWRDRRSRRRARQRQRQQNDGLESRKRGATAGGAKTKRRRTNLNRNQEEGTEEGA